MMWQALQETPVRLARFSHYVMRQFFADDGLYVASALTFTALLALVPLMSVGLTLLAAFPVFQELSQPIQDFIFDNFVPETGETIQRYLTQFAHQATQLSITSTAFLIVTAIMLMFTVERAFNNIWQIQNKRSVVSGFILYWAVLSLAPLLMGLGIFISSYFFSIPLLSETATILGVTESRLFAFLPFLLSIVTFTFMYLTIPNCRVPFWHALLGALFAAVLFEFAKRGFSFYIQSFDTYQLLYGAFSAIPLFFFWLYYVWVIILLGAEIAHALSYYYQRPLGEKIDPFTHAYHWLGYLWQAQQTGKTLSFTELLRIDKANYAVSPREQIQALKEAKLISEVFNGNVILSRDLSYLTLGELYELLPWKLPAARQLTQNEKNKTLHQILTAMEHHTTDIMQTSLAKLYQPSATASG